MFLVAKLVCFSYFNANLIYNCRMSKGNDREKAVLTIPSLVPLIEVLGALLVRKVSLNVQGILVILNLLRPCFISVCTYGLAFIIFHLCQVAVLIRINSRFLDQNQEIVGDRLHKLWQNQG